MNPKILSFLEHTVLVGIGAALTYAVQAAANIDFGVITPIIMAGLTALSSMVNQILKPPSK